jgi:hypothetical protein
LEFREDISKAENELVQAQAYLDEAIAECDRAISN